MSCEHQWCKVHEQALFGGSFPVGWECMKCNKYVSIHDLTPEGLQGTVTKKHKLFGAHGGGVSTESGKACKYQIYDEDTKELTYG